MENGSAPAFLLVKGREDIDCARIVSYPLSWAGWQLIDFFGSS